MCAFDRAWAVVKSPVVEMQVNFLLAHPNISHVIKSILQEARAYQPDSIEGILKYVYMMAPADAQHIVGLLTEQFTGDVPTNEPDSDPDLDDMMETPRGLRGME